VVVLDGVAAEAGADVVAGADFFLFMSPMASAEALEKATIEVRMKTGASLRMGNLLGKWEWLGACRNMLQAPCHQETPD
jgi:hypothetical protein